MITSTLLLLTNKLLDFNHQLNNLLLFYKNTLRQFLWWQMFQVFFAVRVLDIEINREQVFILIIFQNIINAHLPCMFVFITRIPPFNHGGKLLKLHRARLGVVLYAYGE